MKGTGVSILATRFIGASRNSKQFSVISALSSPPNPLNIVASCKIITLFVFFTDVNIVSLSKGTNVLRSIKSAEISGFSSKASKVQ